MSAKELDLYNESRKYLEELLKKDSKALRVKLELASIYYKLNDFDKSKELLLEVKQTQPPKRVGDNIDAFFSSNR